VVKFMPWLWGGSILYPVMGLRTGLNVVMRTAALLLPELKLQLSTLWTSRSID